MTNNFNAEQARKKAKDVKIDQALLLEKFYLEPRKSRKKVSDGQFFNFQ